MEKEKPPEVPVTGVIYGEIAYRVALLGILISIVGIVIYMMSNGYLDKTCSLDQLWKGASCDTIWKACSGVSKAPEGHWYLSLSMLSHGDAVAMLGIAVTSCAAVFGMWGGLVGMVRSKGGMYIAFALIVAIILTLAAAGLIVIKE